MNIGDIVWTISRVIEAEEYDPNAEPEQPHVVKVVEIMRQGKLRPLYVAQAFDPVTGEPDDDTNATVHLYIEDVFRDERAAWLAYEAAICRLVDRLNRRLAHARHEIEKADQRALR